MILVGLDVGAGARLCRVAVDGAHAVSSCGGQTSRNDPTDAHLRTCASIRATCIRRTMWAAWPRPTRATSSACSSMATWRPSPRTTAASPTARPTMCRSKQLCSRSRQLALRASRARRRGPSAPRRLRPPRARSCSWSPRTAAATSAPSRAPSTSSPRAMPPAKKSSSSAASTKRSSRCATNRTSPSAAKTEKRPRGYGDNLLSHGAAFFKSCELVSTYGPHGWPRNPTPNTATSRRQHLPARGRGHLGRRPLHPRPLARTATQRPRSAPHETGGLFAANAISAATRTSST